MALGADVEAVRELPGLSTVVFCCEKKNASPEGCWVFLFCFLEYIYLVLKCSGGFHLTTCHF